MKRRLAILLALLLLTLGVTLVSGYVWLTRSSAGARWALTTALGEEPAAQALTGLTGNFRDGIRIPRFILETPAGRIEAEDLFVRARLRGAASELLIERLEAHHLAFYQATVAGDQADSALPNLSAPLPIELVSLSIAKIDIISPEGVAHIEGLALSGRGAWNEQFILNLEASAPDGWGIGLSGHMGVVAPYPHEVQATIRPGDDLTRQFNLPASNLQLRLTGDLQKTDFELSSGGQELNVEGQWSSGQPGYAWTAMANAPEWQLPAGDITLTGLTIQANGEDTEYRVTGAANVQLPNLPGIESRIEASGDLSGLRFDSLRLVSEAFAAEARGSYQWSAGTGLNLQADLDRVNPAWWMPSWPANTVLNGHVDLGWANGPLTLSAIDLAIGGLTTRLTGSGVIDPDNGSVQGTFELFDGRWPLTGEARVSSRHARIDLKATGDAWEGMGHMRLQAAGYPEATVQLTGNGSGTRAGFRIDQSEVLGGQFSGDLELDWAGPFTWRGTADARRIDPAPVLPDWPGRIDARVRFAGGGTDDAISLEIDRLDGELLGHPIRGKGQLRIAGSQVLFRTLELNSGEDYIRLDGSLERGLDFDLAANRNPLIARWLDAEVAGKGRVRAAGGLPEADLDLSIRNLRMTNLELANLRVSGQLGGNRPGAVSTWTVEHLTSGQWTLDRVEGTLTNEDPIQRLRLRLEHAEHRFDLEAEGRLDSPAAGNLPGWKGQLTTLTWTREQSRLLALAGPAGLDLSGQGAQARDLCLLLEPAGRFCTTANWQPDRANEFRVEVERLPLKVLAELFGHEIQANQVLAGTAWWSHAAGSLPSGQADFRLLTPGADDKAEPGVFGFRLDNGELTEGRLYLPIADAGVADIDFAITDFALDGNGRLDGRARLDLDNLSFLQDFVTLIEPVSGRLDVDARLGGRTAEPHLDGRIALRDARFNIPTLELENVGLSLAGEVSQDDRLLLQGQLVSGPGQAEVKAAVNVSDWDDIRIGLTLKGERLALINVPSLSALANPDLHLVWRQGGWRVEGGLLIPEAKVAPVGTVSGQVNESEDVEIVAGALPDRPAVRRAAKAPLSGTLKFELGDDVRIDMTAIKMKVTGALELDWQGAWLPVANGQLLLNGDVQTYGPRLVVENGPVRFHGRPLNDPSLDIRAERDIFGNTQIQTAGVHVRGTARSPVIEAYTVPLTNEDRAWTLLLTGSDFEYGQGIGAFDIGTYIAPRLYISYGVSLFDEERSVSARYDLRRGLGIKATASQEGNGIDGSLTIER